MEIHSSEKKYVEIERLDETKETVETTRDTCKYKIVQSGRD